jgi:hypothetical protein
MQKLSDLYSEIKKIISLNIVAYEGIENYTYNNKWVTDLNPDYFEKQIKKIEKSLDKNINYDDEKHIEFLKMIKSEVINAYKEQSKYDYSKLSTFESENNTWDYSISSPKKNPRTESLDLPLPNPTNLFTEKREYIIEGVKEFYNIEKENISFDELNEILLETYGVNNFELGLIYGKAHLSYVIWLHQNNINIIFNKLERIFLLIADLKGFSDAKTEENNLNTSKLMFKCRKYEIAYIFKFLFDYGYIDGSERARDSEEYIKKFLDENETYYFSRNTLKKVEDMTKEFTRIGKHSENHITKEIKFSEQYIENLKKRIEYLKTIE